LISVIALPGAALLYASNASQEAIRLAADAGFAPNYTLTIDPAIAAGILASGAVVTGLIGATLFAFARKAVWAALALAVLSGLGWHVMFRGVAAPNAYALRLSDQVAALREYSEPITGMAPQDILTVTSFKEASLVFLLGSDTVQGDSTPEALAAADALDEPVMLVLDLARDRELQYALTGDAGLAARRDQFESRLEALGVCHRAMAPGLNYAGGDETVLLVFFTRCAAPESR
jgi:hypothetical protein